MPDHRVHSEPGASRSTDLYRSAATCSGSTSTQEWTLESNGNIQLEGSSTCLSAALIPDENPALYTGAPQTCWTSSSEDMQQWTIESDGELFLNNGGALAGYSLATEAGDDKSESS